MRRSLAASPGPKVRFVLGAFVGLGILVAACSPAATPAPTATPSPSPAPTATPVVVIPIDGTPGPGPSGGLGSVPYDVLIPSGWQAFDPSDPTARAGLDAFVAANPNLAASIQGFESIAGVRMAINPSLGDFLLLITTPTNGLSLDLLAQTFSGQFQAVPGLQGTPSPQNLSLAGGDAVHWLLTVTSNKPGGGTISAAESIYLFANATDAAIVELVTTTGGAIPDESAIVASFHFKS